MRGQNTQESCLNKFTKHQEKSDELLVREWLFVGHWGICFAKNNGNVSTLVCQMAGCTTCRVSDSWRGEENVISYSCADLLPPTTTMYLGSLSELVLTRMLSKFGAKSLESSSLRSRGRQCFRNTGRIATLQIRVLQKLLERFRTEYSRRCTGQSGSIQELLWFPRACPRCPRSRNH